MNEEAKRTAFMTYFNGCTKFNGKGFDMMMISVHTYAIKYGLEDSDMITITRLALETRLSFIRIKKFLRSLVPRIYVPDEVTDLVLKYLFKRVAEKEAPIILNYLLHWLTGILKYKLIITKRIIYEYYDNFYDLFNNEHIAVATCHLVFLLTSPEDVNNDYKEKLMKLHSVYKLKEKYHFGVLLRLFKCYRPHIVPESISFYSVNKHFGTLTPAINHALVSASVRIRNNYKIVRGLQDLLWHKKMYQHIVNKHTEVKLIPEFSGYKVTNHDIQNLIVSGIVLRTLYDYGSATIDEPTSIVSLLNDFRTRCVLALADELVQIRLCIELGILLKDAFFMRKGYTTYEFRDDLLRKIAHFQREIHQAIPCVTEFIAEYLDTWEGLEHQNFMLNLFEWLNIKSIPVFNESILSKIKKVFLNSARETKCFLLLSVSRFIMNAMAFQAGEANGANRFFLREKTDIDFSLLFENLLKFLQNICISAINNEDGHPQIMNTIKKIHSDIFDQGYKVAINEVPVSTLIQYWPSFVEYYNILCYIGEMQIVNATIE